MDIRPHNGSVPTTALPPNGSSSIERLLAATQDMIAKRIDLALLEGRQLSRSLLLAATLCGAALVLGGTALMALVYALVAYLVPPDNPALRACLFGAINIVAAGILAMPAYHAIKSLGSIFEHPHNGSLGRNGALEHELH